MTTAWTRTLTAELRELRQGDGLNTHKIARSPVLLSVPVFHGLPAGRERSETLFQLLVWWLGTYGHDEGREALSFAYALEVPDDAPDSFAKSVQVRRRYLKDRHDVGEEAVRTREDAAIDDLVADLLDATASLAQQLQRQVPVGTAGSGVLATDIASIVASGVIGTTLDFYRGVPWDDLFERSSRLDIFFTYGRSWRRSLTRQLASFLERAADATRVVLPDIEPPNTTALPEIAKRAGQEVKTLTRNIEEARDFFLDSGASVWMSDAAELYASYRFDDLVVVTLYNHQRGQTEGVPTFTCRRSDPWFEWFSADFEALIGNPQLARKAAR